MINWIPSPGERLWIVLFMTDEWGQRPYVVRCRHHDYVSEDNSHDGQEWHWVQCMTYYQGNGLIRTGADCLFEPEDWKGANEFCEQYRRNQHEHG